jgi:subtilisin family serine protease
MHHLSSDAPIFVGVIDSGWDRTIPESAVGTGVAIVSATNDFAISWSLDDRDRLGHGTAVTDIILQHAPGVRIIPIRVFGSRLETSPQILIAALNWAVAQGIRLVNLSLGTERHDVLPGLYRTCELARRAGTIVVASAGPHEGHSIPAIFDPVIGVAASSTLDPPFHIRYRAGSALECEARGIHHARGLKGVRQTVRGSSFAAPLVTAYVARVLQRRPDTSLESIRQSLREEPHSMARVIIENDN